MQIRSKSILLASIAISIFALSGCETIPYPERVATYEGEMRARFVGKSADELVLAFGPPHSSYTLSDGRDVLQYTKERTTTSGGDSYTSYDTAYRTREVRDKDGTVRTISESYQVPRTNISPVYTNHERCVRRFVVTKEKIVEAFAWEGNSCF